MRRLVLLVCVLVVGCGNVARWPTVTPPLQQVAQVRVARGLAGVIRQAQTAQRHMVMREDMLEAIHPATLMHQAGSTSLVTPRSACGALPPDAIDFSVALDHVGESRSVQGTIVAVGRSKRAVFLNFHDPYQGYFSGVIFISAWKHFPGRFEDIYTGQCVRIRGEIKLYNGAPEIVIADPSQITLLTN